MSITCYVYYRVAPMHLSEASSAARDTIDKMRHCTGIDGQLMTKVGEPLLWMEVYEDIMDEAAFLDAMRDCVELTRIDSWLDGDRQRHTELFETAHLPPGVSPAGVS